MSRSTIELSTKVRELRNDAQIALFQINKLTEENKRLRAALERTRDFRFGWRGTNAHEDVEKLQQIAREALE
jgi:hypothetical protein